MKYIKVFEEIIHNDSKVSEIIDNIIMEEFGDGIYVTNTYLNHNRLVKIFFYIYMAT